MLRLTAYVLLMLAVTPATVMFAEPVTESIEESLDETPRPAWQIRAEAQLEARRFKSAETILETGIERLEDEYHRYHNALIEPLVMQGDARFAQGNFAGAIDSYQRAVHIDRVNSGLHNPAQVPIVYKEATSYSAMGDFESANERQEYAYNVLLRTHGSYAVDLLPGLFHLARWYQSTNDIYAARGLYEHAVMVAETQLSEQSPEMYVALHGLAESYRLERFPPFYLGDLMESASDFTPHGQISPYSSGNVVVNNFSAGERTLQRLIRIQREAPNPNEMKIAEAILDLADWNLLFKKNNNASTLYQHVYDTISGMDGVDADTYFAEPRLLHFPQPANPDVGESIAEPATGHVTVSFTVTPYGSVNDIETLNSEPEGLMDFRVRRSMRYARFRPQLIDGAAVEHPGTRYTWEFPYIPDGEEVEAEDAVTAPAPPVSATATPGADAPVAQTATIQDS